MTKLVTFVFLLSVCVVGSARQTFAQTTEFTYQGSLKDNAVSANANYDFEFALFDSLVSGSQVGPVLQKNNVSVTNGLFSVKLDFGAVFPGADRFLEIRVRLAGQPGITTLGPRQLVNSAPQSIKAITANTATSATSATTATTAGNVTGVVALANGGTGGTDTASARTNLGLGTLATLSPSGSASATTFLRGDNSWQTVAGGVTGTGTNNYVAKFSPATGANIGNSLIQDSGTSISFGLTTPSIIYQGYFYRQQLTANGDGQSTLFGYRTRDSQNDGISYAQISANTAVNGYNFWGDVYTFGVGGWNYNDYSRTGGTLGADVNGLYWGSLGYRSSGLLNYGVYGSAAYASGGGRPNRGLSGEQQGIGGGFYGGMIGSWSRGDVMGSVSSGDLFASYNVGNVYTSGYTADVVDVKTGNGNETERVAAYAVTSTGLKAYDNGSARLDGESVFVPFSKVYAGMLSEAPDVTVSAVGSPAQLYIKSIEKNGFTVAAASGTANVKFSWIAVGNRVDANKVKALPAEIADKNFDTRLKDAMFNENDKENSGAPVWYDGNKVRFDKAPEQEKPAKVEPKPAN